MNMNFLNNKNNNWIGLKTLILFMIVFLTVDEVQAQDKWRWLNPIPQGNPVVGIHFSSPDSGWFIAKELYKTEDGGQTWQLSENSPSIKLINMFFLNSSDAFIMDNQDNIARTRDGGESWEIFSTNSPVGLNDMHFVNRDTGFAVGSWGTIMWTFDGGESWIQVHSDSSTHLLSLHFATDNVGYAVGFSGSVFKTINGGTFWISIETGVDEILQGVFFATPEIGWVVGHKETLLKTVDGGETWESQSNAAMSKVNFFEVVFKDSLIGYAAGSEGRIFSTRNGGEEWIKEDIDVGRFIWFLSLSLYDEDGLVAAGSAGLIMKKDSISGDVSKLSIGTSAINFQSIDILEDNTIFVGGLGEPDANLYKSTDLGVSWEPIPLPNDSWVFQVTHDPAGNVYVPGNRGKYYRSSDIGETWESYEAPVQFWGLDFPSVDTGFGFHGQVNQIYKTINAGMSWELIFEDPTIFGIIDMKFLNTTQGIAVGSNGFIATTNDGGETWERRVSGAVNDVNKVKYYTNEFLYAAGSWGTFLKSLDGGETWEVIDTGFEYRHASVHFSHPDTGWIGGDFGQIHKTYDGGTTWLEEEKLSFGLQLSVIGVKQRYVIFASGGGNIITNMPYSVVSVTDEGEYEPLKTPILRNYPNPFNPVTIIEYSVEQQSHVTLKVYNILGQEIAIIVDRELSPGNYSTILNASNWTSGIYISNITITELNTKKEIILSRKLVLMK